MKYSYPAIGSNLSKQQEDSLRNLSALYFKISDYTRKHLSLLIFPLLINDYQKLWEMDEFQEWRKNYAHATRFKTIRERFVKVYYLNIFDLPDLRFCLDGWEYNESLSELIGKLSLMELVIEEAEAITYKVVNKVLQSNYGKEIAPLESGIINFNLFRDAVDPPKPNENYQLNSENENFVFALRIYCNSNYKVVEYIKRFPVPIRNLVREQDKMSDYYRYVLQEVYGSLNPKSKILYIQNTELAEAQWYFNAISHDEAKDLLPPCQFTLNGKSITLSDCFIDFPKLNQDFKSPHINEKLNDVLNLMVDLVV